MLQRLTRRPRRILMTVDAVGGVWQYALGLAEQLVRHGNTVMFAGVGPLPTAEQLRQAEAVAKVNWLRTPPDWMGGESDMAGLSDELSRLVQDLAIELVQLNAPTQAADLSVPCPVVVVSHSCVVTWFQAVRGTSPQDGWEWHKASNRAGFDRADAVIAPSESHASALTQCYGPLPSLRVVQNAVPAAPAGTRRHNVAFAAARWWDVGKNGHVLDSAAARTTWPVVAAGPTKGPNDAVTFRHAVSVGSISNTETRHRMAGSGIFVSPSLYEPFGLAALEAAAAGTPLVLADIPTYRELWSDAAVFFPPRDAGALAEAVNRLASSDDDRRRLGAAARRRAGRYSPARQSAAMLSAYDEAALIHAQRV
jgi:hypothetical protein